MNFINDKEQKNADNKITKKQLEFIKELIIKNQNIEFINEIENIDRLELSKLITAILALSYFKNYRINLKIESKRECV